MKIIKLDEIDSTNEYAKRNSFSEDTIVIASRQTSGNGTKGRSFVSDCGGIYLSLVRINPRENAGAFSILINACVAVCKTLEAFALKPVIRWANDVLCEGRKISGTLIENRFSDGRLTRSIVGVGLNVNNALPDELASVAVSMKELLGKELNLSKVEKELIENLQKSFSVTDYKSYINYFGKQVSIDGKRLVTALDVDERGRLIVSDGGKKEILNSAEVTLRL